jgi:hypothetical protein
MGLGQDGFWTDIGVMLCLVVLFLVLIIGLFIVKKRERYAKLLNKLRGALFWNFPLRMFLEAHLKSTYYYFSCFNQMIASSNPLICVIILPFVFFLGVPLFLTWFIVKKRSLL